MDVYDVIIIGAGLYGIAAARCYLEIHPDSEVIIMESESVVGGTWSSERMYDDFWTQTPLGMAEFSDRPLKLPPEEKPYHGYFPARYITRYLEEYLDSHKYSGKTLRDRVLLSHEVDRAENHSNGWNILCKNSEEVFITKRLILASGLTSTANMPSLPNRSAFSGRILHHREFGQSEVLKDSQVDNIAVLGGAKSAADMAYTCAKAGKSVSWVLRESGCGPAGHARGTGTGLYQSSVDMFSTRMSSSFSPSIFTPPSTWSWLLHGTNLGSKLVSWIWSNADRQNRASAGYQTRKSLGTGFEKLEPETPVFWQNDGSGINQRPDFWEVIASMVHVYRSDLTELSAKTIKLRDGTVVPADTIICATGWDSGFNFLSAQERSRLGLPSPRADEDSDAATEWQHLDTQAREEVLQRFPSLAHPPAHFARQMTTTPYRLYKAIAPLDDKSVVILGHIQVGNNFMAAECQALWAVAYFDGRIDLPPRTVMAKEIALNNAWCSLRYLDKGNLGTWYYFDLVPYVDMLLGHIGFCPYRRPWPLSVLLPVTAKDLRELCQEYKEAQNI